MALFSDLNKWQKTAVIDDTGASVSYSELSEFISNFNLCCEKRALIFILSENRIGALAGYVGSLANEVVPLIIGADTDRDLFLQLCQTYHPAYIWVREHHPYAEGFDKVFHAFGYGLFKTGLSSPPLHPELALLLSTSGSTGSPKLVRHSYQNIEANAKNVSLFFELTEADRPIAMLPLQYTMGLSVVTSHMYVGSTILLVNLSLTDAQFWKFIKENKASSFTGVPYSFEVLEKLRFFRMDLPELKLITQGGGKMKEDLFIKCGEYASKNAKRFIATYGQTEGTARMAFLPHQYALSKIGSIGKAIPGGQLSLIDENGNEILEAEATGLMVYKGPNVTLGYATRPDDLALGDVNNGVLHTGDIARRDSDGFYYIVGRNSRFVKLFGLRIGLDEVENLIKNRFQIDCVCSGNDDKLILFVTDMSLADEVKKFVVEKTGLFHQALEVRAVPFIERNATGKVIFRNADH